MVSTGNRKYRQSTAIFPVFFVQLAERGQVDLFLGKVDLFLGQVDLFLGQVDLFLGKVHMFREYTQKKATRNRVAFK